jgi:hypothetical protein
MSASLPVFFLILLFLLSLWIWKTLESLPDRGPDDGNPFVTIYLAWTGAVVTCFMAVTTFAILSIAAADALGPIASFFFFIDSCAVVLLAAIEVFFALRWFWRQRFALEFLGDLRAAQAKGRSARAIEELLELDGFPRWMNHLSMAMSVFVFTGAMGIVLGLQGYDALMLSTAFIVLFGVLGSGLYAVGLADTSGRLVAHYKRMLATLASEDD